MAIILVLKYIHSIHWNVCKGRCRQAIPAFSFSRSHNYSHFGQTMKNREKKNARQHLWSRGFESISSEWKSSHKPVYTLQWRKIFRAQHSHNHQVIESVLFKSSTFHHPCSIYFHIYSNLRLSEEFFLFSCYFPSNNCSFRWEYCQISTWIFNSIIVSHQQLTDFLFHRVFSSEHYAVTFIEIVCFTFQRFQLKFIELKIKISLFEVFQQYEGNKTWFGSVYAEE